MNADLPSSRFKAILFDLDGTVYAGEKEVLGASDFIKKCLAHNIRCLYVTNRANRIPEIVRDQLLSYGIPCRTQDVVTTALAAARYIRSGSAYIIGESGLETALRQQGITLTDQSPDYVVVSIDRQFSYDKLAKATELIYRGSKFIATNRDAKLKLEGHFVPGTGAIVAAIQTATGITPLVLGKPERPLIDMALEICGCTPDETLLIGDNLATDIGAGIKAGIDTVLLLTGVSSRSDIIAGEIVPTYIAEDFAELDTIVFG